MPVRFILLIAILVSAFVSLCGSISRGELPERIERFAWSDIDGRQHSQDQWPQFKAVVIVFLGTECPVSNGYAPQLERLHQRFRSLGAAFYGVHCDPDVTAEVARQHATEYGLTFPLLLDHQQQLAGQTGARIVPEAVVLSPAGRVLYRGRIDNRYSAQGQRRPEATSFDLSDAITAVLEGRAPQPEQTQPFGCPLPPRPEKNEKEAR
jgi:peroxiredoxin